MTREVLFVGGPMHGKQMAIQSTSAIRYMDKGSPLTWFSNLSPLDPTAEVDYETKEYIPRQVYLHWRDDIDDYLDYFAVVWWVATPGEWSPHKTGTKISEYLGWVVLMAYLVPSRWPATLVKFKITEPGIPKRKYLSDIGLT